MRTTAIAISILAGSLGVARAEVTRCSEAEADLSYVATDLAEASGDTGWFPASSPAQLRITGKVRGETTVAMGLAPKACWHDGMRAVVPGRAATGLLDSEYGAQLQLFGQIHTSVLGYAIDWSGEIPLHFLPTDLLMAGTTAFDPVALPDSEQPSVSVGDTTSPVVLLSTDLLTEIIDIVGISGGLNVNVRGEMTTSYATAQISLDNHAITSATGGAAIAPPAGGFGASLTAPLSASGVVTYQPSLIFAVAFDVKILGIRVVNWQLASVTLPLSAIHRPVELTSPDVAFPLPHLGAVPASLGFASGASQHLALHNGGKAPLSVELASAPAGVTATAVTVPPGGDATMPVTAANPTTLDGALVLTTNDPNHATISVELDPSVTGQTDTPDPDAPEPGGCNAGRGNAAGMLFVGLIVLRRRRRR